jgi:hypothetical protein
LADQLGLNSPDANEGSWDLENEEGRCCAENGIRLYRNFSTQPQTATLFSSIYSSIPLAYVSGEIDAFVECLHVFHEHQAKSKEDNYLFSPAIFVPGRSSDKPRGKGNIAYLRHVVLDFENGELQPEELPDLFPDLRMVVTNTFRHTSEKPRYRAVFFTGECMTPEVYSLIYGCLADKLEEAGYSVDRKDQRRRTSRLSNSRPSGLDWSKSDPTSLFYFPCQAEHTKDSFFIDCVEGRCPLNPSMWVENTTVPLQPDIETIQPDFQSSGVDEVLVQSAIQTWRSSKGQQGKGNSMFFDLALTLKRAGMSFQEIEGMLRSEAQNGTTPKERLAQIPSIMNSLSRYFAVA